MTRMKGDTARVQRVVRACQLLDDSERMDGKRVSAARREALQRRIAAVLPQLSADETEAYYVAVRRLRYGYWKERRDGGDARPESRVGDVAHEGDAGRSD